MAGKQAVSTIAFKGKGLAVGESQWVVPLSRLVAFSNEDMFAANEVLEAHCSRLERALRRLADRASTLRQWDVADPGGVVVSDTHLKALQREAVKARSLLPEEGAR